MGVALLALLIGCGTSISKDSYLERGDAICKQAASAQAKLKAPAKGDLAATARYLRASAGFIDQELSALRKLGTPSGDGERLRDLLGRESDAIATLRAAAGQAEAKRQKQASQLFTQAQNELADVGAGLRDYGFSVCGS
jgi:hypothetical protein